MVMAPSISPLCLPRALRRRQTSSVSVKLSPLTRPSGRNPTVRSERQLVLCSSSTSALEASRHARYSKRLLRWTTSARVSPASPQPFCPERPRTCGSAESNARARCVVLPRVPRMSSSISRRGRPRRFRASGAQWRLSPRHQGLFPRSRSTSRGIHFLRGISWSGMPPASLRVTFVRGMSSGRHERDHHHRIHGRDRPARRP